MVLFVVGVGALPEDWTLVSEDSTVVPHLPTLHSGGTYRGSQGSREQQY